MNFPPKSICKRPNCNDPMNLIQRISSKNLQLIFDQFFSASVQTHISPLLQWPNEPDPDCILEETSINFWAIFYRLSWNTHFIKIELTLHKKWAFPLRISSVNPQFPTDLVTFAEEILNAKTWERNVDVLFAWIG